MTLLNPNLYQALREVFQQDPEIANPGTAAGFSCPPTSRTHLGRKTKRMVNLCGGWGECYVLNCPACGDTRRRLYFSHTFLCSVKKNSVTYYFGRVYKCHNESCNLSEYIQRMDLDRPVLTTKPQAFTSILMEETSLPKDCLPLLNEDVPAYILDYVRSRGFDPVELANEYFIHVARKGSSYQMGDEKRTFFDDRLIVPLIQGARLVGWQARRCKDIWKDRYKYLNSKVRKSHCLYNRDVAMFHRDVVIVEGVTDCWRIGPKSVALFGKSPSPRQVSLLKSLWGFSGRAVVCFDSDAESEQEALVSRLRIEEAFPRGVSQIHLPPGVDPASLTKGEMDKRISEALETAR